MVLLQIKRHTLCTILIYLRSWCHIERLQLKERNLKALWVLEYHVFSGPRGVFGFNSWQLRPLWTLYWPRNMGFSQTLLSQRFCWIQKWARVWMRRWRKQHEVSDVASSNHRQHHHLSNSMLRLTTKTKISKPSISGNPQSYRWISSQRTSDTENAFMWSLSRGGIVRW